MNATLSRDENASNAVVSKAVPAAWVPSIRQVDDIVPGCRFHVGSGTENFRIGRFGGEEDFTRRMIAAIRPGDVFFDVGTCVGFVAVHAARAGATVVGFEPEPQLRARALENVALNELSGPGGVRVMDWAVSDREGVAELFSDGPHGCSPTLAATAGRTPVSVRTRSIDDAIHAGELPRPTLLKLDIEGAEVRALHGMRDLLAHPDRPRELFLEVHPPMLTAFGDSADDVKRILTAAGYELVFEEGRWEQSHQIWKAA